MAELDGDDAQDATQDARQDARQEVRRDALAQARHGAVAFFARRSAHDLNNFATIIRSYCELLLSDLTPGSSAHADASEIYAAAESMVIYLRRIARFTRVESSRAAPVDVEDVAAQVISFLGREEPGAPMFLEGGARSTVEIDASWLGETITELVRNAREASPSSRPVIVQVREETARGQSWVVVRISDEGPGFDDAVSANAEDPFVTTKHGIRGAGFGLSIATAFARHVGGRLVREREEPRTHVSLWLPA
jgi:signal transduction histidine kinase